MRSAYATEDLVVGILAAIGIVVLIVVFVWVVRDVLKKGS
jgi:hypothetical protein